MLYTDVGYLFFVDSQGKVCYNNNATSPQEEQYVF